MPQEYSDKVKARKRAYYIAHRDEILERNRQWKLENKDRVRETSKLYKRRVRGYKADQEFDREQLTALAEIIRRRREHAR